MKKLLVILTLLLLSSTIQAQTTTDEVYACFYASPMIEIMQALGNDRRQLDIMMHYGVKNECFPIKEGVDIVILGEAFRRYEIYKIGVTNPKTGKVIEMYSHPAFFGKAGVR